jgi:hypothetical protein
MQLRLSLFEECLICGTLKDVFRQIKYRDEKRGKKIIKNIKYSDRFICIECYKKEK